MKVPHLVERYGFCPVTEPLKRKEAIQVLTKEFMLMAKLRKEGRFEDYYTVEDYEEVMNQLKQLKRIDRGETDMLYFMYQYLGADMNPDFEDPLIPAGVSMESAPDFHRDLTDMLNVISNEEVTKRIAWASPRGSAKSAYLSNAFPLHEVVYQKRKYILIISETDTMSKKFVDYISTTLKHNKLLKEDFGELLSTKKVMYSNEKDNQEAFLTKSGTLVEASSMGKALRGKRNGSSRPDLILLDDLESAKNTNTADLREKNLHWFDSVVLPIGDPDRTAFVYMGTAVHQSGLLFEVMKRSDFESKLYSAIISPPDRQDLWDKFDEIIREQENPNRQADALGFYEVNKEEMDKGVEVLWEARQPYVKLMVIKANMTSRAFASEYLNNPVDEESQIFNSKNFIFWDYDNVPEYLDVFGAWDMAFGKSNRSDYNAVVIIGRDRYTGIIYILYTWAEKCQAHKAMEKAVEIIREYTPKTFVVETVQAQFDLYRQLQDRLNKEKLYFTKLKPMTTNRSHGNKEARIEQLEPLFEHGVIRPHKSQRMLLEQLDMFPYGDNDDLPDALAMATSLCSLQTRRSWGRKPKGM